jgi:hypothetical protein
MSRFSAAQQSIAETPPTIAPIDEVLFKSDRPRHIDRFIDYFGTTEPSAASDQCGEAFLSTLEDDE